MLKSLVNLYLCGWTWESSIYVAAAVSIASGRRHKIFQQMASEWKEVLSLRSGTFTRQYQFPLNHHRAAEGEEVWPPRRQRVKGIRQWKSFRRHFLKMTLPRPFPNDCNCDFQFTCAFSPSSHPFCLSHYVHICTYIMYFIIDKKVYK